MNKNWKKMSIEKQENTYGGWAWVPGAISLFLETIMTSVLTYKIMGSNSGSAKYSNKEIKWDDEKSKIKSSSNHTFYVF